MKNNSGKALNFTKSESEKSLATFLQKVERKNTETYNYLNIFNRAISPRI